MFRVRIVCLLLVLACVLGAGIPALAAEVECDAVYCFTTQDFSSSEEPLAGICITALPQNHGTLLLGSRVLQPGDILTAGQIDQMTFAPVSTEMDVQAEVSYLPIYENRVESMATMTVAVLGKEDLAPVAQDSTLETYKNLPRDSALQANDPENQALTYSLVRAPRRGQVEIRPDGTFTYTPKKNKAGVDSFTYTAADPAGNVSREATVTVQVLKSAAGQPYADTEDRDCRFEAEWLRSTGLFEGESVSGQHCFRPDASVSRGEFLAMLVQVLDIPTADANPVIGEDTPQWLKPYLAAALRSGLLDRLPTQESGLYDLSDAITGEEVAVMVQNALDLPLVREYWETDAPLAEETLSIWAESSVAVLAENGIPLPVGGSLTRSDAARLLYQVSRLAPEAPGMAVIRMQK